MRRTRNIYVIRPRFGPRPSGAPYHVLSRERMAIGTEDDLRAALALHSTMDDVPADTPAAFAALQAQLAAGRDLVQHVITVPDRRAEATEPARVIRSRLSGSPPLVGAWTLAGLLAASRRRVYHAFDHGLVDVIESDWKPNQHGAYRYALVNDRMRRWVARHARRAPIRDVELPRWLTWDEVEAAAGTTGVSITERHGVRSLYVGWAWVRWATSRQPDHYVQKIIEAQVTS